MITISVATALSFLSSFVVATDFGVSSTCKAVIALFFSCNVAISSSFEVSIVCIIATCFSNASCLAINAKFSLLRADGSVFSLTGGSFPETGDIVSLSFETRMFCITSIFCSSLSSLVSMAKISALEEVPANCFSLAFSPWLGIEETGLVIFVPELFNGVCELFLAISIAICGTCALAVVRSFHILFCRLTCSNASFRDSCRASFLAGILSIFFITNALILSVKNASGLALKSAITICSIDTSSYRIFLAIPLI